MNADDLAALYEHLTGLLDRIDAGVLDCPAGLRERLVGALAVAEAAASDPSL
jgi:MinD-like ATPase involved in chromosome partitioning or flagellar assembly